MAALDHVLLIKGHVVAQIVKAQLVVRAVGDIGSIGGAALVRLEIVDDEADREAEEAIDLSHPLRVALGQIIVDRDNVHALARQGIEIGRQDGDQRFAFAGLHLRDAALMQHDAADDLHREVLHAQHAPRGLAAGGKRFRQDVVERLAVCQSLLKFWRHRLELLVGHFGILLVQCQHLVANRIDSLELALGVGSKDLIHQSHNFLHLIC